MTKWCMSCVPWAAPALRCWASGSRGVLAPALRRLQAWAAPAVPSARWEAMRLRWAAAPACQRLAAAWMLSWTQLAAPTQTTRLMGWATARLARLAPAQRSSWVWAPPSAAWALALQALALQAQAPAGLAVSALPACSTWPPSCAMAAFRQATDRCSQRAAAGGMPAMRAVWSPSRRLGTALAPAPQCLHPAAPAAAGARACRRCTSAV